MKYVVTIFVSLLLASFTLLDRDGSDAIKVYPMPVKGVTRISTESDALKIEVYNILGTKVLERQGEGDLDFSSMQSGYYIIKAYTEKGELVKRVQKY